MASHEEQVNDEINKLLSDAEPCTGQTFEEILDYIDQRSFTYRMFRNEFTAPNSRKRHSTDAPNNIPGSMTKMPFDMYYVPLPSNRSLFTVDEMKDLFAVFTAGEGNAPTAAQFLTYSKSIDKLKAENTAFLSLVKQRWSDEHWSRTTVVKDPVAEFVAAWWKNRIPRIRGYPPTYMEACSISLTPTTNQVKLEFQKNLYTTGRPARYWSNPKVRLTHRIHTPPVLREMMANETFYEQATSSDDVEYKLLSQDKIAEGIAVDNHVQLVLTPSTLATLLSNNPVTYDDSWCIPFVVKEYQMDSKKDAPGEHTRKIVYFDKKFVADALTAVQKNRIFAKYAVRTVYLWYRKHWKKLNEKETQLNEEANSETEGEGGWGCDPEESEVEEETVPKFRSKIYQKQVYYNLWECSAADPASVLSKHHKKPFKVLIRTPVRGQLIVNNGNPNPESEFPLTVPCTLMPKIDYQPEYGAQLVSFSEIAKEWVHAVVRPNSVLHRVRVDPIQGTTIMIEKKQAVELSNDCMRLHSRSLQNQLSILQNLVDALGNLQPGNYLLNHRVKDRGFMFVYHEQNDQPKCSRTSICLRDLYGSVDTAATVPHTAPWLGIDTSVITPTFHSLNRIPCVFAPVKSECKKRPFLSPPNATPRPPKKKNRNRNKKGRLKMTKKTEAAGAAAAEKASKSRQRIPYHDVDSVTNEDHSRRPEGKLEPSQSPYMPVYRPDPQIS